MGNAIAYGAPPVEGPFTVVYEFIDATPGTTWQPRTVEFATEDDAVSAWGVYRLYVNTRPVSITPEPNWARYSYDGHTPLTKGNVSRETIKEA